MPWLLLWDLFWPYDLSVWGCVEESVTAKTDVVSVAWEECAKTSDQAIIHYSSICRRSWSSTKETDWILTLIAILKALNSSERPFRTWRTISSSFIGDPTTANVSVNNFTCCRYSETDFAHFLTCWSLLLIWRMLEQESEAYFFSRIDHSSLKFFACEMYGRIRSMMAANKQLSRYWSVMCQSL